MPYLECAAKVATNIYLNKVIMEEEHISISDILID